MAIVRPSAVKAAFAAATLVVSLLAVTFAASPAEAASSAQFSSPSRNIGCYMDASEVRCDILSYTYKAPKKPSSCQFDWGSSMGVGKSGKGHFNCVSDTVAGSKTILKYGKSKTVGRFRCTSRANGITCKNLRNGHGFRLSKTSYSRF